jgi:hypothetical protein
VLTKDAEVVDAERRLDGVHVGYFVLARGGRPLLGEESDGGRSLTARSYPISGGAPEGMPTGSLEGGISSGP